MKTKLERIRYDIDELAKISVTQGPGCCRQTYTKEFAEARDYIVRVMKEIGLSVREDAVGNIFGRMEGKNPEAPVIMTGSHFDTVRTGGRFDGLAGVVAALEVARVMKEEGFVPNCPIEFVATAEEEGTRFSGGLFGSRAMCGQLYENELENSLDMDGISMAQAMKEYGLDPEKANEAIL
ncbi:MAG: M20/M25/M40 family metallo-hydrolase, partial [Lachnospiraceae bacterium]|nr:M20/M25/M40 family metallo-hydrolase [Lachnospiraceae bacterium]